MTFDALALSVLLAAGGELLNQGELKWKRTSETS